MCYEFIQMINFFFYCSCKHAVAQQIDGKIYDSSTGSGIYAFTVSIFGRCIGIIATSEVFINRVNLFLLLI